MCNLAPDRGTSAMYGLCPSRAAAVAARDAALAARAGRHEIAHGKGTQDRAEVIHAPRGC